MKTPHEKYENLYYHLFFMTEFIVSLTHYVNLRCSSATLKYDRFLDLRTVLIKASQMWNID